MSKDQTRYQKHFSALDEVEKADFVVSELHYIRDLLNALSGVWEGTPEERTTLSDAESLVHECVTLAEQTLEALDGA